MQLVDANNINPDGSLDFTPPFDKPYDWTVSGRAGLFKDLVTPAGLVVHPYTFRNEAARMPPPFGGNPVKEYLRFYELGVDGVFSDFADTAFAARAMFLLATDPSYADCLLGKRKCDSGRDDD